MFVKYRVGNTNVPLSSGSTNVLLSYDTRSNCQLTNLGCNGFPGADDPPTVGLASVSPTESPILPARSPVIENILEPAR